MTKPSNAHPALAGRNSVSSEVTDTHLGTRTGIPSVDELIPGRSSLVTHLGKQSALHLAVARVQSSKEPNPHELAWIPDDKAHPLPLQKTPSKPLLSASLNDLGTRSSHVPIGIALHHTTPGGAWFKVTPGAKPK